MTLTTDLTRAAELLEETAQSIKESNAVGGRLWVTNGIPDPDGKFAASVAKDKADHDEMLRLAKVLRRHAKYLKSNPVGGPAKVFDAIADRIRAGEDRAIVLDDYGLKDVSRRARK